MHLAAASVIGAGAVVPFDTIDFDPNGNLTLGSTANYTCPVDGYYWVNIGSSFSTSLTNAQQICKNGVAQNIGTYSTSNRGTCTGLVKCLAGDTLDSRPAAGFTNSASTSADTWFEVSFDAPA